MSQNIKPQIKWTEEKIELLRQEYPLGDKKELARKLGIKYQTLKEAARRFEIKSEQDKHLYKLKFLTEFDNLIACYWLGFIIADGHISQRGQLVINLAIKDISHLEKLAKILDSPIKLISLNSGYSNNGSYCLMTCDDNINGKELLKKFNIQKGFPKTENPVNLDFLKSDEQLLSFFLGFFDGDGCFSKNPKGEANFAKIENHNSWVDNLEKFKELLSRFNINDCRIHINSRGYADFRIYKHNNLRCLKLFAIENKLPILERKWNLVNEFKMIVNYNRRLILPQ